MVIFNAWIAFIHLLLKQTWIACKNNDFGKAAMSSEILEFNQYQKSDKGTFIIYADLESLIEKIDVCKNNPEKSFATK